MKIAIQGAGIAGPALAFWLQRYGHEPVLIEKAPRFRTGGYMIDFWGLGYTIAERMGILPQVLERGYKVREVRLVNRRGHKAGGFSADVFNRMTDGRFISLPRGDLAEAIYDAIRDRVETIFGNSISNIEEHASGVHVTLENGSDRDFDLVIGADGLHSRIREIVFGPERQFERQLGYRVAAFEVAGYRPRDELVYVGYNIPGRMAARFALRNDRTLFLFVFREEFLDGPEPESLEERKELLRNAFGQSGWELPQILAAMDPVHEIYYDRVSQIRMECWSKGRVMLLGDAAACVSLLAGEGCGLAMTEAYLLAGELKLAGNDYREAFQRSEERLRPFLERKQESARNFATAFAPKTAFGVWFRNSVAKLMTIRPVADFFIGRDLRDDFELPEYEC